MIGTWTLASKTRLWWKEEEQAGSLFYAHDSWHWHRHHRSCAHPIVAREIRRTILKPHSEAGRNQILPVLQVARAVSGGALCGQGGHFQGVRHWHRFATRLAGHRGGSEGIGRAVCDFARQRGDAAA